MNYVVILDKFWPNPEANGLCIQNIIDNLDADFVSIICRVTDESLSGIHKVSEKKEIVAVYCEAEKKYSTLGCLKKIEYIIQHAINSFWGSLPEKKFVDKLFSAANELQKKRKYDWVISVLNPIEAVEAGKQLKNKYPTIRFLIYNLDSASNCSIGKIESTFRRFYMRKVLRWEKSVFSKSDLIVNLDNHQKHFSQMVYSEFMSKMIFQGVPLLKIEENTEQEKDLKEDKKRILYAGAFYHRLREPSVLLDIVNKAIEIDKDITLNIYTKDNYVDSIRRQVSSSKIIVHSFVDQKTLSRVSSNSGALISIGNKTTEMFPSKIISYIASMKPIVHIYQNLSDPVISFLKQYPNALLLDGMVNTEINAKKLVDFLNQTHTKITTSDVETLLEKNTGKHCADEIRTRLAERGIRI